MSDSVLVRPVVGFAPAHRPPASWALAMLGFFVVPASQVVNVALPYIRRDLTSGLTGLQWVCWSRPGSSRALAPRR